MSGGLDMAVELQRIYDSEINISRNWMWDGDTSGRNNPVDEPRIIQKQKEAETTDGRTVDEFLVTPNEPSSCP